MASLDQPVVVVVVVLEGATVLDYSKYLKILADSRFFRGFEFERGIPHPRKWFCFGVFKADSVSLTTQLSVMMYMCGVGVGQAGILVQLIMLFTCQVLRLNEAY